MADSRARILMVCTGNICRSPAMHYVAADAWGDAAQVKSAGTYAEVGMDATAEIRRSARAQGMEFPRHRPTQLDDALVAWADLVLAATDQHARWITRDTGQEQPHVFGLKQAAELASRAAPPQGDTPAARLRDAARALREEHEARPAPLRTLDDPWGHSQAVFDRVYGEIVDHIATLTRWTSIT